MGDNQPSHPPEGVYIVAPAGKICVEPVNGQMTAVVNPIIWALRIYMVTFVFLVAEDGFPVIITAANDPVRFPVFGEPLFQLTMPLACGYSGMLGNKYVLQ